MITVKPQDHNVDSSVERISQSKRSLVKNGWAIPLIVGITLPNSGFAKNISAKPKPRPKVTY
jgi:hypothetical protein